MKKLSTEALDTIAQDLFKNTRADAFIIAENGTVFRVDQKDRVEEYMKEHEIEIKLYERKSIEKLLKEQEEILEENSKEDIEAKAKALKSKQA
ncbi:hypothetical protein JMN32_19840 [Fulvivirga sp. 29W222]|uniref:Uncharacterized protein n=1 Tax=Fulvivirga marina TaxID=2494733 RepID=A0A937G139_9BACT|nr:hypothetical protein [Fulvivirga marina]MBL6448573.1 hypothetical protein [Fulvivirga marina]